MMVRSPTTDYSSTPEEVMASTALLLSGQRSHSTGGCSTRRTTAPGQKHAPAIEQADDCFHRGTVVAPRFRYGDIWIGRFAGLITAADDRIRQEPGRCVRMVMLAAAAPTLHMHRAGSGRLSRAPQPAAIAMRIGRS